MVLLCQLLSIITNIFLVPLIYWCFWAYLTGPAVFLSAVSGCSQIHRTREKIFPKTDTSLCVLKWPKNYPLSEWCVQSSIKLFPSNDSLNTSQSVSPIRLACIALCHYFLTLQQGKNMRACRHHSDSRNPPDQCWLHIRNIKYFSSQVTVIIDVSLDSYRCGKTQKWKSTDTAI